MNDHLQTDNIKEEKIEIGGIPAILFRPREERENYSTIVFYHGWSSNKDRQRVRAFFYASLGYQVLLPDAINHGERDPVMHQKPGVSEQYFWPTVIQNIDEWETIRKGLVEEYKADPDNIGITGHSMGGFAAAGIFTHNPEVKALVVLNGSCYWKYSNEYFTKGVDIDTDDMDPTMLDIWNRIDSLDPMNNLDKLKNRPILMLNGNDDKAVPPKGQRLFYNEINPMYDNRSKLKLIRYPELTHFVTTNMMEDSIIWFHKYLAK